MNTLKTIQNISKKYLGLALALAVLLAPAPVALRADVGDVCEGVAFTAAEQAGCGGDAAPTINKTIATAVNIFSVTLGLVAVIMIMIAGFKYVTSGGDANSIASAKQTILYAIVGLIIVALAQIIVVYVLGRT